MWKKGSPPRQHRQSHGFNENPVTPPVELEIRDILDLHAFPPKEIPEVVEAYLEEALRKGFTTVRIIHGKGTGVQRERVHAVLRHTPFVERFQVAPAEAGSWGATIVWFRTSSQGRSDNPR
ncbi:MAG: Smr/MutS family protein [Acidobacteria bacterium]|nr:Smr/MutS family protein [Acidobacteriota bacterium]